MIQVRKVRPLRGTFMFLFIVAAYQYFVLSTVFVDIRVGSANLQVVLGTLLLVFCALIQSDRIVSTLGWQGLSVLSLGVMLIPLKILIGQLQPAEIQGMRIFFLLPLIWSLYRVYVVDEATKVMVATIIIWNCVFIALFGLAHFFFFPSVVFSSSATEAVIAGNIWLIPGHSQEAAFLGNPSAYGAILCAGMFVIYLTGRYSMLYSAVFLLMVVGTFVSISRAAVGFSIVLAVVYFGSGARSRKNIWNLLRIVSAVAVGAYVILNVPLFGLALKSTALRAWNDLTGTMFPLLADFGQADRAFRAKLITQFGPS